MDNVGNGRGSNGDQQVQWDPETPMSYAIPNGFYYAGQFYQHPNAVPAGYGQAGFPYFVEGDGFPYMMGYSVPPNVYDTFSGRGGGGRGGRRGQAGGNEHGANNDRAGNSGTGGRRTGQEKGGSKGDTDKLHLEQEFAKGDEAVAQKMIELEKSVGDSRKMAETTWQGEERRVDDKLLSGDSLEKLSLYVFERIATPGDALAKCLVGLLGVCVFGSQSLRLLFVSSGMQMSRAVTSKEQCAAAVQEVLQMMRRLNQENWNGLRREISSGETYDLAELFAEIQAVTSQLKDLREAMRTLAALSTQAASADTESAAASFKYVLFTAMQGELMASEAKAEKVVVVTWARAIGPLQSHLEDISKKLQEPLESCSKPSTGANADVSNQKAGTETRFSAALLTARRSSKELNSSLQALLCLAEFSVQCGVVPSGTGGVFAAAREIEGRIERIENSVKSVIQGNEEETPERRNTRSGRRLRFEGIPVASSGRGQRRHARMKSSPDELLHLSDNLDKIEDWEEDQAEESSTAASPVTRQLSEELDKVALEDREEVQEGRKGISDKETANQTAAKKEVKRDHIRSRSVEDIIQM